VLYSLVDFTDVSKENMVSIFSVEEQTARQKQKADIETGGEDMTAIEPMGDGVKERGQIGFPSAEKKRRCLSQT
jgi:hypothetical protein